MRALIGPRLQGNALGFISSFHHDFTPPGQDLIKCDFTAADLLFQLSQVVKDVREENFSIGLHAAILHTDLRQRGAHAIDHDVGTTQGRCHTPVYVLVIVLFLPDCVDHISLSQLAQRNFLIPQQGRPTIGGGPVEALSFATLLSLDH